jgi:hypothetical protein
MWEEVEVEIPNRDLQLQVLHHARRGTRHSFNDGLNLPGNSDKVRNPYYDSKNLIC